MPQCLMQGIQATLQAAARRVGSDRFSYFIAADPDRLRDTMLPAHHRALAAIKSGPGKYPVGVTLAMADEQAVGPDSKRDAKREALYGTWLDAAGKSDFVGVQTYTRTRVGKDGDLPPEPGTELTQMGYEFWPEALGETIRYASARSKVPVYVTENGYRPKFGLVAVNRETQERTVKPSARYLGGIARRNGRSGV